MVDAQTAAASCLSAQLAAEERHMLELALAASRADSAEGEDQDND